jgi:hypothetical protein
MSLSRENLIPSAARLMESLRDIGYDLPAAVADLVDNSIDAGASSVDVTVAHQEDDPWIRIADNGHGMSPSRLDEAMRYGSRRAYGKSDLGRFGLGLKTASLSQCRRLTIATRRTPRARIEIRRWDLDEVSRHNEWRLERPTPRDCAPALLDPLAGTAGTVVMWENLDRLLGRRRPNGVAFRAALYAASDRLAEHLEMVFHRFILGEAGGGKRGVTISLDGTPLAAWDPFARDEPHSIRLPPQTAALKHGGRTHDVTVQPYILPTQIQFSSPAAHARAAGPARWNRQQGLYIYRADRLIQSGGWNRLRTMDEHSKLARIALDVPAGADGAFGVNVSKMRVTLPAAIRPELMAIVSGVVTRAQAAYRRRVRLVDAPAEGTARHPAWNAPGAQGVHDGMGLSGHWPLIVATLERELHEHPDLLRRTLVALANTNVGPATVAAASAD